MIFAHLSRQYASQLLFEVLPSKTCNTIILSVFFTISLAIFMTDTGFIVLNILAFLVLVYFSRRAFRNNCRRQLQWQADGQWLIFQAQWPARWPVPGYEVGQSAAEMQPGSVVTPYFAILNFKLENRRILSVLLFKDNIDKEKFRQLRVRLKVEGIKKSTHDII